LNKITAYPNIFHAVRTLTNFEYQEIPVMMKRKKIRLEKLRVLASEIAELLRSECQLVVSCGRIEVSLQGVESASDVMHECKKIALSQLKVLSMKLVPIVDILKDLDAVASFVDSVGSDGNDLTPKDKAELAILSNMCGLWSWKFKAHLDKKLGFIEAIGGSDLNGESLTPYPLFNSLDAEERQEILAWYVGCHSKTKSKFTFRTFNTKGGLMRKKRGPPITNGAFDTAEAAAEKLLELAVQLEVWSPIPKFGCWNHIDYLCKSRVARDLLAVTEAL
jgi:hypothetical protein